MTRGQIRTRICSKGDGMKKLVWIVDEDVKTHEELSRALESSRVQTQKFFKLEEVWGAFAQTPAAYPNLILCDLKVGSLDEFAFIEQLKREKKNVPVVLMASDSTVEKALQAIRKGAFDYVTKPLDLNQLEMCMERAFRFSISRKDDHTLDHSTHSLIVKSESMQQILHLVDRIASTNASVLLTGESGTGKEVIARSIHLRSQRASKAFVAVNCSAIPEALLESELFGHAKGSFTGAIEKKLGLFEEAHQGTLMLDEIGELSLPLQAKLLRVIQEKKIKRVGENSMREVDVRVIAATHRNLIKMVKVGSFREDLYFRLNVIPIHLSPLRERKEDIAPLAAHFIKRSCRSNHLEEKTLSPSALEKILSSPWKGNVRELENALERAVLLSDGPAVEAEAILVNHEVEESELSSNGALSNGVLSNGEFKKSLVSFPPTLSSLMTIEEMNLLYIHHVLNLVGNIRDRAAKILGIDRKTLYRKLHDENKMSDARLSETGQIQHHNGAVHASADQAKSS